MGSTTTPRSPSKPRVSPDGSSVPAHRRPERHGLVGGITYSCEDLIPNRSCPEESGASITRPVRILAIDPGSRYMGVAFLLGPELIRADVENVREAGGRSDAVPEKAEHVLRRWIERYQPEVIAIEQTFFTQSKQSRALRRLTKAIETIGRREGLIVQSYPPTRVRRFVCADGRPTRLAVARIIATKHFPWLYRYYEKEANRSWWRKHYWTSMFDAIAVGLTYQGKLSTEKTHREAG